MSFNLEQQTCDDGNGQATDQFGTFKHMVGNIMKSNCKSLCSAIADGPNIARTSLTKQSTA
eukprot:12047451-Karenia_brevis.AAC.1